MKCGALSPCHFTQSTVLLQPETCTGLVNPRVCDDCLMSGPVTSCVVIFSLALHAFAKSKDVLNIT